MKRIWGLCGKIADFFYKIVAKFFPDYQLIIPLTVFYQNQVFHIFLLFGDIYGKAVVGFVLFLGLKIPLQKTSFVLKW